MKARSSKRARAMILRRQLVAELLEARPWCEIRWSDQCEGRAVDVDEIIGRGVGGSFLDRENCQTACRFCHSAKTANPREAARRGLTRQVRQCSPTAEQCVDATPCMACPWREDVA